MLCLKLLGDKQKFSWWHIPHYRNKETRKALPAEFPSAMQLFKAQRPVLSQPIPGTIVSISCFVQMNYSKYFSGLSRLHCTYIRVLIQLSSASKIHLFPYTLVRDHFCAVILPAVSTQTFVRYQLL